MGSAKGAKVSTNDSTLGDPAAEEPPMKISLGYPKTKKLSALGATPPDPRPALDPAGGSAPGPPSVHPGPSSKFPTTPLTLGLYSIFRPAFGSLRYLSVSFCSLR